MKNRLVSFVKKSLAPLAASVALLALAAHATPAQIRGNTPPGGLSPDREQRIRNQEQEISGLERDAKRKRDPKEVMAEINEDFIRLQTIRGEMSKNSPAGQSLNLAVITDTASEVKRRAARLKNNLVFPDTGKEEKRPKIKDPEKGQLQPLLSMLDGLIMSFTTNPVFKESGIVDLQLAAKAKLDLEQIIELSEKIRKNAEKMSKSPGN